MHAAAQHNNLQRSSKLQNVQNLAQSVQNVYDMIAEYDMR